MKQELKELWKEPEVKILTCAIIFFVVLGVFTKIVNSYFEAQSWNKLTGGKATTWDAMFVELRVDCVNQEK